MNLDKLRLIFRKGYGDAEGVHTGYKYHTEDVMIDTTDLVATLHQQRGGPTVQGIELVAGEWNPKEGEGIAALAILKEISTEAKTFLETFQKELVCNDPEEGTMYYLVDTPEVGRFLKRISECLVEKRQ